MLSDFYNKKITYLEITNDYIWAKNEKEYSLSFVVKLMLQVKLQKF